MDPSSTTSNAFTVRAIQALSRLPHGPKAMLTPPPEAQSSAQAVGPDRERAQSTPRHPAPRQDRRRAFGPYRSVEALISPWVGSNRNLGGPSRSPAGSSRTKRRLALRPSLLGTPQIRTMSLEKRAELVCEVAADFMLRVVKEVLEPGQAEDWRQSWGTLQSLRKSDLFPSSGPLFPKAQDVINDLPAPASTAANRALPERAIHLCNLATFTYIILCPDEAEALVRKYEDDPEDTDFPPRRSHRGMTPAAVELAPSVARRNAALMKAWRAFWSVLITREKRTSQEAVELWLEFSTQLSLTHQCPTIDPPSSPLGELPSLVQQTAQQLLADDAVETYGELEQIYGESDAESIRQMDSDFIHRKWVWLASARRTELEQGSSTDMMEQYPYVEFAHNIAIYVQAQLSGLDVQLVRWDSPSQQSDHFPSPGRLPSALHPNGSPNQPRTASLRKDLPLAHPSSPNPPVRMARLSPDRAPKHNDTPIRAGNSAHLQPSPSIKARFDEMPTDMDLLSSIVGDLDAEFQSTPTHVASSPRAIPARVSRRRQTSEEEDGWTVREAHGPVSSSSASGRSKRFNFSARQADATRVEWDSQSPARPSGSSSRHHGTAGTSRHGRTGPLGSQTTRLNQSPGSQHVHFDPEDIVPSASQLTTSPLNGDDELEFDEEDILPSSSQLLAQARAGHSDVELDPDDVLPSQSQPETQVRDGMDHEAEFHPDDIVPSESQLGRPEDFDFDADDVVPSQRQMETLARDDHNEAEFDPDDVMPSDSQLGTPAPEFEDDDIELDDLVPSASQLETQAQKRHEQVENDPPELDADDVLPKASQFDAAAVNDQEDEIDMADIPLSESQSGSPDRPQRGNSDLPALDYTAMDHDMVDASVRGDQLPARTWPPMPPIAPRRPPTSQRRLHSSRVERIGDALEFVETHSGEDEDDRLLLRRSMLDDHEPVSNEMDIGRDFDGDFSTYDDIPDSGENSQRNQHQERGHGRRSTDRAYDHSRQSSVDESWERPTNSLGVSGERDYNHVEQDRRRVSPSKFAARRRLPSPRRMPPEVEVAIPTRRAPIARAPIAGAPTDDLWPDPHMIDEDGSPLDPDPTLVLPPGYKFEPSRIHGRKNGQLSSYSRLAGGLRWTKDQELLLYRTIQKVPLVESYPAKVIWYLHGEYGKLSRSLEQFNPQHMKDKMRTIVETRVRNNRPVVGRARHWLSTTHPDKAAFDAEVMEFWYEQRGLPPSVDEHGQRTIKFMGERVARPKKRKPKRKRKDTSQDEMEEEELEQEEGDEQAVEDDEADPPDEVDQENEGEDADAEGKEENEEDEENEENEGNEEEEEEISPDPKRPRRSAPVAATQPQSTRKARPKPKAKTAGPSGDKTRSKTSSNRRAYPPPPEAAASSSRPPATRTRARRDKAPDPTSRVTDAEEEPPPRQLRSSGAGKRLSNGRVGSAARDRDVSTQSKRTKKVATAGRRQTRSRNQQSTARAGTSRAVEAVQEDDDDEYEAEERDDVNAVETQEAEENVRRALVRRKVLDQAA